MKKLSFCLVFFVLPEIPEAKDQDDIPSATNYVAKAINEISEGKAVSQAKTKAYGCSVKY